MTGRGVTANISALGADDSGFESQRPERNGTQWSGVMGTVSKLLYSRWDSKSGAMSRSDGELG